MTTIVVAKKDGKVGIGADSLTTFGTTKLSSSNDQAPSKLFEHDGSVIGICGSAATQLVIESILKDVQVDLTSREKIHKSFTHLHKILKEEAFLNPKEDEDDPYESSQITCLIANDTGIYGVYSLREVFEYQKFWGIGSGMVYALGAMNAVYNRARDVTRVVQAGVFAGCEFDSASGLPMNMSVIKLKG